MFSVIYSMKSICNICEREYKFRDGYSRKRCPSCNTKIRRVRIKQRLIEIFGGKCVRCGWKGHWGAYEFHHKDPKTKKFQLAAGGITSWENIKKEANKCELLCSNCHQIEHVAKRNEKFWEAFNKYKGRNLD